MLPWHSSSPGILGQKAEASQSNCQALASIYPLTWCPFVSIQAGCTPFAWPFIPSSMAILHHGRLSSLTLLMAVLLAFRRNHSMCPKTPVPCILLQILLASLTPACWMSVDVPQLSWQPILTHFQTLPGGVLWLPNFENQWVPNLHSHLINAMPLLLTDTQVVHHTLAQLVTSSQSWEWFFLCVSDHFSFLFRGKF